MGRITAATVCVVAGDDRRATKSFLSRVAEELGEHDNLCVLGRGRPGPEDPGAWRLPARGGLARAAGPHAPRPRPVVVLVEDRVEPEAGFLDQLVDALADRSLDAVAPRTNMADGDELYVGVPYRPHDTVGRRQLVRDLAAGGAAPTPASVLAGPCLAVRRERLEALGGLASVAAAGYDPARVTRALHDAGHGLAVVERSYLHHRGGATLRPDPVDSGLPLLTACMIVKDEEQELPRCLESLAGVVDEVVVYDTGSTDATKEIASQAGARVLEGYWDDDFGRARNDALAACRGQWILWVDADESLVCEDARALRCSLRSTTADLEAFVVHIENLNGNEAASTFVHPACRLFRRAHGRWDGRLHELVVARSGERELARELTSLVRITHRGYLQSHITSRDKAERNVRTAFADLAGDSDLDWGVRLASLGRSYVLNGRFEEGLAHCRRAAEVASLPSTARLALRTAANCLVALGRPEEALEEIERLRGISSDTTLADSLAGAAHLALGQHALALEHFARVRDGVDEDGFEYSQSTVAVPTAEALVGLGRHGEAADALLSSIRESGGVDAHIGLLLECLEQAGRDLGDAYDAIGPGRAAHFVPQLLQLKPAVADRTLEAWHGRDPAAAPVLAAASHVARRLDVSRQLVWSSRLRSAGLGHACPLVAAAADENLAARDRVLAGAAAFALFDDARARLAFGAAVLALDEEARPTVAAEVAAIAPGLSSRFDQLRAARRAAPPAASDGGRQVLVVDREAGNPRATGLAIALARAGHHVTLLHPEPTQASTDQLAALGVALRGWATAGIATEEEQDRAAVASIARCAAERPFDVVALTARAVDSVGAARAILPVAAVVLDLSSTGLAVSPGSPVDLLLRSGSGFEGDRRSVVLRPAHATVPSRAADRGIAGRDGVAVLASSRRKSPEELEWFARELAPRLAELLASHPVVVVGDDPDGALCSPLPASVAAGAVADPTPWLRAARVALIPFAEDADTYLALAASAGLPATVVGAGCGDLDGLLGSMRRQLEDDARWQEAAPAAPVAGDAAADPLAGLAPAPRRAPLSSAAARPQVRVTGGVFGLASLAQMNRELLVSLSSRKGYELSACTRERPPHVAESAAALRSVAIEQAPARRHVDLEIRHQWPPDFTPGSCDRLVVMQPWEFGGLPAEWIAPIRDVVDELWVPTTWVRECAIRSGVDPEHVRVVPYGVDTSRFSPEGDRYELRTRKRTKLLFVGGLIERKGVDALIETYLTTFDRSDDVCLVLKPFGSHSVYRTSSIERDVRASAAGSGAEIEIVDDELDFASMAALYRSVDVLVHPYRGEGFGMPIAEAMASCLPVVVTSGGAADDFCDDDVAWLVPGREVPVRPESWTLTDAGAWWLEPDRTALSAAMRAAVEEPETRLAKGTRGRARILERLTWEHAAARAAERIDALLGLPPGGRAARSGAPSALDTTERLLEAVR